MTLERLEERIAEVLAIGGPRKHALLVALALRHGYTREAAVQVLAALTATGRVKQLRRQGGLHYAIRLDRRRAARAAKNIRSPRPTRAFVGRDKLLSCDSPRRRKTGAGR